MKIVVISGHGDGHIKHVEVAEGTTISELCAEQFPEEDIATHLVRVNRATTGVEQVLCDGDRVTITPLRIEGARV